MRYTLEIEDPAGAKYVPLTAKTDRGARSQARKWLREVGSEHHVFVSWFRASDGCRGFLNPDGRSNPKGRSWK